MVYDLKAQTAVVIVGTMQQTGVRNIFVGLHFAVQGGRSLVAVGIDMHGQRRLLAEAPVPDGIIGQGKIGLFVNVGRKDQAVQAGRRQNVAGPDLSCVQKQRPLLRYGVDENTLRPVGHQVLGAKLGALRA